MICEPCNECTCAKCLPTCSQELVIGVISLANTPVFVYFLNSNNNRADRFNVTTEVDGTVKVDLSTFKLMPEANYEIWVTAATASSIHDMESITIGLDTAECLVTSFVDIDDSANPKSQVSYTSQTIELCEPTIDPNAPIIQCMLRTDFILTSAQILDLHNTQVEIIAAPGAGKIIVPVKLTSFLDYNSIDYAGGSKGIAYKWGTAVGSPAAFSTPQSIVVASSSVSSLTEPINIDGVSGGDLIINQPVVAENLFAAFTAGNSEIKGSIYYEIRDFS